MNRRQVIAAMLAAGAVSGTARAQGAAGFDAAVGAGPVGGPQTFATLAAAIAAAPEGGSAPYRILVRKGRWYEKLVVARANIHLIGEDRDGSVVTYDRAAGEPGPDGKPWGTPGCASVIVRAPGFHAENLTIENAFDYVGNLQNPNYEKVGSNGLQAVALMLDDGSDRARFDRVTITGHQDTLFANAGSAHFSNCRIAGSVDFIFGAAHAAFERCEIVSRFRPLMQRNHGFIAVPSTPRAQRFGLVFFDCRLEREKPVPPASVVLGRPWRPAKTFADGRYGDPDALGNAAFLRCWMDDHISADGWDEMGYAAKDGTRAFLEPGEARLFEYASTGPGAFRDRRRRWLTPAEARACTVRNVLA